MALSAPVNRCAPRATATHNRHLISLSSRLRWMKEMLFSRLMPPLRFWTTLNDLGRHWTTVRVTGPLSGRSDAHAVERAFHARSRLLHDVGVDHGGADVVVRSEERRVGKE